MTLGTPPFTFHMLTVNGVIGPPRLVSLVHFPGLMGQSKSA
jgi:hypothetical protein